MHIAPFTLFLQAVLLCPLLTAGVAAHLENRQVQRLRARRSQSKAQTISFAKTSAGGFQGTWVNKSQSFLWGHDKDFMLTWDVPATQQQLNITASDAVQANGPLTLLHALGVCQQNDAFAVFLQKARDTKTVSLHILGVNSSLEPAMEWDRFLAGPLLPKHRRLVEAFNLPVTPFAGMTVSLLFVGNNRTTDSVQGARRLGAFLEGYSEAYVSGLYHLVVDDIPDLALAINPGFAFYPKGWWPTLKKLHSHRVPIIATGYSGAFDTGRPSNIRLLYEHQQGLHPQFDGYRLRLPSPKCKTLAACIRSLTSRRKVTVHALNSDVVYPPPGSKENCKRGMLISNRNSRSVCADLDGNEFLATRVGYKVALATHQPFAYCDDPALKHCQSSAVVSIFEPNGAIEESSDNEKMVLGDVIREDLSKMMRCHSKIHLTTRQCMEKYFEQQSSVQLMQEFVLTHVLNSALLSCEKDWDDALDD